MTIRAAMGVIAVSTVAVLSLASAQDPEPKLRPGPFVSFIGDDSKIDKQRFVKVTTEKQWAALWLEHKGQAKPEGDYGWYYNPGKIPVIDFEQCMVIGVFEGSSWNSAGVKVEEIHEIGERLRVRFDNKSFQTSGPDGGGVRVKPYGLFVLPRIAKPVVLEENVQGLIGKPPKWKERATL